ncbi:hypothetical protein [Streptomyces sp. IBSBF 2435]|uniref:hypothetical protein n=1 Tax=Streptomyces sp. IBSBF 2435 TaxID=2903531 RepID=UPI002FDBC0CF
MTAPAQQRLAADSATIRTWLGHLYAGQPGLISICSDADGWAGRRFTTDEAGIEAAVNYSVRLDKRHPKGIYAQVTTLRERPEEGRGGEDLAHALTHLWADGDFGTIGHKPSPDDLPAPPDMDAVAKVVAESGLPAPSGWTLSGGGYNSHWMLADRRVIGGDADRARVKEVTTGWQAILAAQAYVLGWSWDAEVGNLDRLMKLPGTVNRKEGLERPTSIGPGSGVLYDFDDLAGIAAQLAPAAREVLAQAASEKQARKAQRLGRTAPPPRPPRSDRPAQRSGTGPLDVLADMLEFRDVLEPAGFTYQGQHSDGREKWLRPTANGDRPSSAYSLLCDDHVAINWSERSDLPVGAQAPGNKLTIGTLWAHLNYGGNTSEAARDIKRAAGGHPTSGAATRLPAAVLTEVRQRCLTESRHGFEDLLPPTDAAPPVDWSDLADGTEPSPAADSGPAAPQQPMQTGRLPEAFWAARPVFQHIRQAAHSRGCSGDVLLFGTLARLSGMISHHLRADTGIGSRASLNIFAATVGPSGAGKSTGQSLTRDLMPHVDDEFRDGLPVGTGEGIAEMFMGVVEVETGEIHRHGPNKGDPVTVRKRQQVRHNAYLYVDEGQTLAQLGARSGSVLAETLRRAAVGETLGQTNASEERTRYVAAGTYSLGLLVGFQPSTAMPLIADASTGTPQRFLWCWATDPSIPDEPPAWPGPIEKHPGQLQPAEPVNITFPDHIRRQLWREHTARARGEVEVSELDGHAGLMKVKLAAIFALLDGGRYATTEADWELAEMLWAASCGVRESLIARAQREAAAERERQEVAAVEKAVREHNAKQGADLVLERVARLVRKHASQVGGITYGALNRTLASRDRPLLEKAVALAVSREWVFEEGDHICVTTD